MVALLLALLMSPPAAALDPDAPGAPALRARAAIEALPVEARVELRKMYFRYRAEVVRRREQGWQAGLLSDSVIEDVDVPFQPIRLLEDAEKNRLKELANLESARAKLSADANEYGKLTQKIQDKKDVVQSVQKKLRREKGICRDWSDDIWSMLTAMKLNQWTVDDRRRTAPPYHTAAIVCAPDEQPTVCLAFDPWSDGQALVYAFTSWDEKEPGGRVPADYFLHGLPEKAP